MLPMTRFTLRLTRTTLDLFLDALAFGGVAAAGIVSGYWFARLPANIPIRFSLSGAAVGMGPKQTLWLLPAVSFGLFLLMATLSRVPHMHNYPWAITEENALRQYRNSVRTLQCINAMCTWILALLTWEVIAVAAGRAAHFQSISIWALLIAIPGAVIVFVIRGWRLR